MGDPAPPDVVHVYTTLLERAIIELHGGTLLTAAADWAYGRMAAVADPDGNRVELSETPTGRLTGDYAP